MAIANDHTAWARVGSRERTMGHSKHISAERMPIRKGWLTEISIAQKCTHSIDIPSWSQGGWQSHCLVHSSYSTLSSTSGNRNVHCSVWICLKQRKFSFAPCFPTKLRPWPEQLKLLKIMKSKTPFKIRPMKFIFKADFSLQLVQNIFDNKIMPFYILQSSFTWLK